MPAFPFTTMAPARVRRDPLGPTTINQLHQNIEALDSLFRIEHDGANYGKHNAVEVPVILGHMVDGAPPTGYLFDTAFGGATLTRPATGRYTANAVAGVITTALDGSLVYSGMANVNHVAVESKPHTITIEAVSATSFQFRVRELSSALGAGNAWADQNRTIDIGIHAMKKPITARPATAAYSNKQRRDFLTDAATDWNSIVVNEGNLRWDISVEHTNAGVHNVNRIAKGVAWTRWTGAAQVLDASEGVLSCTRISQGVVEILMKGNFSALTTMACFPEPQPSTSGELVITNGEGFATGAGTSTFRFYTYAYSGGNWARADRSFYAAMFGVAT